MNIGIWHLWGFDICYPNPTQWWGWLIIILFLLVSLFGSIWLYMNRPDP